MSPEIVAIALVLLAHTAALFFAGGKAWQLLKTHDKEITYNEKFRHDQVVPRLYQHDELWRHHTKEEKE